MNGLFIGGSCCSIAPRHYYAGDLISSLQRRRMPPVHEVVVLVRFPRCVRYEVSVAPDHLVRNRHRKLALGYGAHCADSLFESTHWRGPDLRKPVIEHRVALQIEPKPGDQELKPPAAQDPRAERRVQAVKP